MARLVRHFVEEPRGCSYLASVQASLEYRLMVEVSPHELESMLVRGWRRFGPAYFRPACRPCHGCISVRLDVSRFEASPSQRRAWKRVQRFRIEVSSPQIEAKRLELHARWHAGRETSRGWEPTNLSEEEYATQFAFPSSTGCEAAWFDGDELVAVGLVDVTPQSVSAAYFFYDPSIARTSPGVANIMHCVQYARDVGARYVYLGYTVDGCRSLMYKGLFKPHEVLVGRPSLDEEPIWTTVE